MAEYSDISPSETYHALLSHKLARIGGDDLAKIQQHQASAASDNFADKLNAYRAINTIIANAEWQAIDPDAPVPGINKSAVGNYHNLHNKVSQLVEQRHDDYAKGKLPVYTDDLQALNEITQQLESLKLPEIQQGMPVDKAFETTNSALAILQPLMDDFYNEEVKVYRNVKAREAGPPVSSPPPITPAPEVEPETETPQAPAAPVSARKPDEDNPPAPAADHEHDKEGKGKGKTIIAVVVGVACIALGALGINTLRKNNQEPKGAQPPQMGGYGRG